MLTLGYCTARKARIEVRSPYWHVLSRLRGSPKVKFKVTATQSNETYNETLLWPTSSLRRCAANAANIAAEKNSPAAASWLHAAVGAGTFVFDEERRPRHVSGKDFA